MLSFTAIAAWKKIKSHTIIKLLTFLKYTALACTCCFKMLHMVTVTTNM